MGKVHSNVTPYANTVTFSNVTRDRALELYLTVFMNQSECLPLTFMMAICALRGETQIT